MNKIYNEDCLEAFKNIPDKSVDLVLTDCPYHIVSGGCSNGAYGNHKECGGILNKHPSGTNDIQYTKQGKFFEFNDIKFSEWLPDAYRVLKDGTHCYIMINARNLAQLQIEAEKVGFVFQQLLVWDKGSCTPNRYYLNACEFILMLRKGRARNINEMGTKNIIHIKNLRGGVKTHPTQKPVELLELLIRNSTNPGEIVLDPFMGTGSTGVACKNLNRDFIGIEIDEKYFNIAKEILDYDK